ncbi:right-handed parallel beta-helix repeat-containing protein [Streptosporangium vulgare]|uniref:Right-handed parallel beta-helix repeat-containing protein n=1 Tax=Streptosporangium vulgare TaxID=46190 RepID=A0ABV5TT01_9ACTN
MATPGQLAAALAGAQPGDVISVEDGTYDGNWAASTPGTAEAPIWLCGGLGAQLTNDGHQGSYALHLDGASYWHLYGFTATWAQKGVVVDDSHHVTIEGLTVYDLGDEGIHLRSNTTDSTVIGNEIFSTGHRRDKFGEGVYIGSAQANWSALTGGQPDRSDRNTVIGNVIHSTTAEPIDVKEGTTNGLVADNQLDAASLTEDGGDSCADIKGNDWLISGNTCTGSTYDGYQTHRNKLTKLGLGDWGFRAEFTGNTATLAPGATGLGFRIHDAAYVSAIVRCNNTVVGGTGFANVPCTP